MASQYPAVVLMTEDNYLSTADKRKLSKRKMAGADDEVLK